MRKKKIIIPAIFLLWSVFILSLAWKIAGFSDLYVKYIFPIFGNTYGRVFGYLPFSAGELLIYVSIAYAILSVILLIISLFLRGEKTEKTVKVIRKNGYVFACLLVFIVFIQVHDCFIMYHTTPIYEGTKKAEYEASKEDLLKLYNRLVTRANELSETFERDEKGALIYEGDIKSEAVAAMKKLAKSGDYSLKAKSDAGKLEYKLTLLKGFYSKPKPFWKSDFFSQQGIMGYYFPFSLEANYNDIMYIANFPESMCHELSHLKGFIFEDEASFISYLACINSGNVFFEYSATLNALTYVYGDCIKIGEKDKDFLEKMVPIEKKTAFDTQFLTEEAWEKVENDALFSTESVNKASETFLDTNLTLNGVESGILSYSELVGLLLKYYYGE